MSSSANSLNRKYKLAGQHVRHVCMYVCVCGDCLWYGISICGARQKQRIVKSMDLCLKPGISACEADRGHERACRGAWRVGGWRELGCQQYELWVARMLTAVWQLYKRQLKHRAAMACAGCGHFHRRAVNKLSISGAATQ